MPISDLLSRRVRAQPEEDDADSDVSAEDASNDTGSPSSEDEPASEGSDDVDSASSDGSDLDDTADEEDDSEHEDASDNDIHSTIHTISFGALAKAQESLGPRKKAGKSKAPELSDPDQPTSSTLDDIRARLREARQQKQHQSHKSKDSSAAEKKPSKHAPTVQSSKRAVSRKRPVIDLSFVPKARDPRFDPTVLSHSGSASHHPQAAREAYAFLDDYRDSELKDLKAQLAKTKDPALKEALKREVRSAGDRMRSIQNKRREEELMSEHKRREKRLIREGKKSAPYYLKKSDLRQQALVKKYQDMGSRERAKALERRRKKAAAKERKDMPMERRGMEDATEGGGRKRKRV